VVMLWSVSSEPNGAPNLIESMATPVDGVQGKDETFQLSWED